ncbi:hypothetical protein LTR91_018872 [Friedmanniomyces endolithicus]|uniref:MAPEG family protein n=1 Tax=Friedmanniomyces endolithicus TaxID=329885 RepID=A0AAN6HFN4_9PEZI|nr:hypothetical protein LTR57_020823 [Friedmanniomyces endolithicus]KAK0963638.1 hypothetical protein LTR91_018872 [Friedmanniomyces endolithicus]KAK1009347.1 hypothetical protein LTS01_001836 [Friedmanniomyces endolithicus]KAK1033789.1 hypothetical protein LTS16_015992 [Friedmanniomyces endolithicus]KAK1082845.1 hypothetical protein LTR33_003635 [Friedmanniomyces endolithicus]
MATSIPTPYNWSIQSIPMAFGLGLVPHLYFTGRLTLATKGKNSTAMPRTNLETWKGKLPEALWCQLARARGAHLNSLEVFPLFAAAVLAGSAAKLPASDLNNMALTFLGARTLYMALYMTITNDTVAYARTGVYAWSIGIPLVALWRAGQQASV